MDLGLKGKVALVTGASRGIGAEIARELAREGCRLVLAGRDTAALALRISEIEALGSTAVAHPRDLRQPEAPDGLVKAAVDAFGAIDLVVANAGATKRGDFLELPDADWQDGFAVKFFAHVQLIRAAWPKLASSQGSVVLISGVGGRTPGAEFTIGGSVNAALLSFTKALSDRGISDGVRVNVVCPGTVRTDRLAARIRDRAKKFGGDEKAAMRDMVTELRSTRIGEPADIARVVAFVSSPQAGYIQGARIDVDGGQTKTL